jgi:hypothetical protein
MSEVHINFPVSKASADVLTFLAQEGQIRTIIKKQTTGNTPHTDLQAIGNTTDMTDRCSQTIELLASQLEHHEEYANEADQFIAQLQELCIAYGISCLIESYLSEISNQNKQRLQKILQLKDNCKALFTEMLAVKKYKTIATSIVDCDLPIEQIMDAISSKALHHQSPQTPSARQ